MFRLEVLQNQWLALALLAGIALSLALVLGAVAVWRLRARDPAAPRLRATPWLLIAVYVGIAVFAAVYVRWHALAPPNW